MNRYPKLIITCLSLFTGVALLAGCTSMRAPPSCPDSQGLQCARVDQIDAAINHHNLVSAQAVDTNKLSVWIAPYTDHHGHYHPARVIDTVLPTHHQTKVTRHGI